MKPEIVEADLSRPDHQRAVIAMTEAYALDPMGNAGPLPRQALERLIPGLQSCPTALIFLAYLGRDPIGIATCYRGFSTFAALPLVNVHDLAVLPEHRGRGIGRALLQRVEEKAAALGCCKITLEVYENNTRARRLYEGVGFAQVVGGEKTGGALFFAKALRAQTT